MEMKEEVSYIMAQGAEMACEIGKAGHARS